MSCNSFCNYYTCNASENKRKKKKCAKCLKKKCKCLVTGSPCYPIQPCPVINPCPAVSYTTSAPVPTAIAGGTSATIGPITTIMTFSPIAIINGCVNSSVINTTTCTNGVVIAGYNATNSILNINSTCSNVNSSCSTVTNSNLSIILNIATGQFTVPIAGRYLITAFIGFADSGTAAAGSGTRQFYIYKIDATTSVVTLLAEDSRNAVVTGNTYISITTVTDANANDRSIPTRVYRPSTIVADCALRSSGIECTDCGHQTVAPGYCGI